MPKIRDIVNNSVLNLSKIRDSCSLLYTSFLVGGILAKNFRGAPRREKYFFVTSVFYVNEVSVFETPVDLAIRIFILLFFKTTSLKIRDSLWDASTENFAENKGHEYWPILTVP